MASVKVVALQECVKHRLEGDCWIVCTHTDRIRGAQRVTGQHPIVGEALCLNCRMLLDVGRPDVADLRIACGACVARRWPVEAPS